ncbi:Lsr2 family protein [Actinomadura sp. SCN-SB]|uniref:histone-like nucleoid-structuring protein Lsr2 n=1 Tax=Actinomadura sp. SCN-SB TaxID=3373092 RepID=UPI003753C66C
MAQQVQVLLVDDLDGGEAQETVSFSLDGRAYEIDLSEKNATQLRKTLEPFQSSARRIRGTARRTTRGTSNRERSAEIREWARDRGIPVNDRGRIPAHVVEQFEAAH